jgi:hypothetical protein
MNQKETLTAPLCEFDPNLILDFTGNTYEGFKEFYSENKPHIYRAMYDMLINFQGGCASITIKAKIGRMDWEHIMKYDEKECITCAKDILPYFEGIEDYEACLNIKQFMS